MIRCQTCGTENTDGSQYCDECGAKLISNYETRADIPNFQSQYPETPIFRGANVTSVGIPPIVEEIKPAENSFSTGENSANKGVHASLVIERGGSVGTEFLLSAGESYIGRWDADNGVFPDVDLDAHDSEAKVSRRHARIIYHDGNYSVEDLGSTNGTFVNRGRRLIPGAAQILKDGDEIIVGKTFLRFCINK
jgi:FHA domain/zinc-ribbon domain